MNPTNMNESRNGVHLKRIIGAPALALTIINFTIGAGIFALPALIGIQLGGFSIFAYLFCGLMLSFIMLCYAEVGTRITDTGGSYIYVRTALGDYAGFVINWIFFFGWGVLGDAAVLNIVADSLSVIFPVLGKFWIRSLLLFILIGIMALVNIWGAALGMVVVKLITIIKLLPILALIIFGFSDIEPANLHWEHLPSFQTFGSTVLVLFFAFAGFETALNVSGEIKNPKRNIPLGILMGGIAIVIIFLLLQVVTQGILGSQMATVKDAPLAALAEKIIGHAGAEMILIATAISCFGSVFGDTLSSPRLLLAGAKDGMFPKFLAEIHPKFKTPYLAILIYCGLIFIFSVSGGFEQLAKLASACILTIYFAVIIATLKLRSNKDTLPTCTFRIPGGKVVPVAGAFAILWLFTSLSEWEIYATLIFIAIISVIYALMKRLRKAGIPSFLK